MFDDKDLGSKILGTPSMSQHLFLKELQDRTNGTVSIADPNNGFCTLSEFSSSMHAQFIRQENKRFNALYPKRAQSAEDLFPFLSDYDYVALTAAPCEVPFQVLFNKQDILDNAVPYDDTYNVLQINKESIATVAGIPFTLYYPILIKVNKVTNIITVQYDINTPDKLKTMSTNTPQMVTERTINGITYLVIVFEMYQFVRTVNVETVDGTTGFNNTYAYDDKFYAAKVESWSDSQQAWVELDYSLSQQVYDTNTPTALLSFDNSVHQLSIRIPQIYFTSGLVSSRVRTTILSTKGNIDVTVSETDMANVTMDFMANTSSYSAPLARQKNGIVSTYNTTRIEGGADPIDFATFRKQVVDQTIYDQVPISNLQIDAAVSKYGFKLTKHLDNLTDSRIFYAGATLSNPNDNTLIPVVASKVIFTEPYSCSTILDQSDDTVTVLPTTLFKYDRKSDTSKPVTDAELAALVAMTPTDYVNALNTDIYTRQPYHVWLNKSAQYPEAKAYNLLQPSMTALMLQRENNHSPVMLNVVSVQIDHQNDGTGGYKFYIYTERSSSLSESQITNCKLILQVNTRNGAMLTFEAAYQSTTTDNYDIYTFTLPTTYRLSSDGYIQITQEQYDGTTITTDVSLNSEWDIRALISRSLASNVADDALLNDNVPSTYLTDYLVVSHQHMTISLGTDLTNLIFNQVTTAWGSITYQTYDTDIPYQYQEDIYMTDRNGYLLTRNVTDSSGNTTTQMIKLFSKGDDVLSGQETTYQLAQAASAGDTNITLNSTAGMLIGQVISGTNIQDATTISQISGDTITISQPVMNDLNSGSKIIAAQTYIDTVTTQTSPKGSLELTVGNTEDIVVGMTVKGFGVPEGTTVAATKDGVVTLSQALTADVSSSDTITIFYIGGSKTYKHRKGDTMIDGKGNPITTGTRSNIYGINMIQFDARLYESQDENDISFVNSIPSLISAKAESLDPIREQLIERTYLYYLPFRTLGDATYGAGDGKQITMPLEMSYQIVYYVNEATKNDTTVQNVITTSTLNAINAYVQNGKISTNELGYQLKTLFSSLVSAIDISGIDGTSTKTVTIDTQGASPSIEKKLIINSAGQKILSPNVTIQYQVAPT